jgi:glycosyltransferase involved in cell wall biosynthesis
VKILMVLTFYHPHWTGLTAYAKRLAEALVRRGHEVTVLTSRHVEALPLEETIAGVRVERVPVVGRLSRGVVMPGFVPALWRRTREADLVQMHGPLLEAPFVAMAGRTLHVPTVFTNHGDLVMPAGAFNQLVERGVTAAMTWALGWTAWITTHSRDYAENSEFMRPFLEKLSWIYPPAEIPAPDRAAAARWKKELGLEGRPVAGFAGRWVEEKGFDFLLRAIPDVLAAMPDAHFVYAGADAHYERFYEKCRPLLDAVRPHVTMLGLITEPQKLANFYALCDAFVLPSRTDCFPSTQLESILCGTPLVSSDTPGAREVVRVTGMGVHVPLGDPPGLARGIVRVLRDPKSFVVAPERVRAIFDVDQCAAEYETLFRELVTRRTRAAA